MTNETNSSGGSTTATTASAIWASIAERVRELQERGLATLTPSPEPTGDDRYQFELMPANPRACAIPVHVDRPDVAILLVGPNRTDLELLAESLHDLVIEVDQWVEGIVSGKYTERVKHAGGQAVRAIASVRRPDNGVLTYASHAVSKLFARGPGWAEHSYEPYAELQE
jgi:hypothetical protein